MKKVAFLMGVALVAFLWIRSRTPHAPGGNPVQGTLLAAESGKPAAAASGGAQGKARDAAKSRRAATPPQPVRYERIHELAAELPDHCVTSRRIMTNLSALLAIGDVVHGNRNLPDGEIQRLASESSGLSTNLIGDLLSRYPAASMDSMGRHYFKALRNPELLEVSKAFQRVGVHLDLASDLLMDGFRLCSIHTSHGTYMDEIEKELKFAPEGFDPLPECLAEAEKFAEERQAGIRVIENAFKERFISRHGLEPGAADALLAELRGLRVKTAGDVELTVPRLGGM